MLSEQDRDLRPLCGFQNNRALLVHVRKVNPGLVVGITAKQKTSQSETFFLFQGGQLRCPDIFALGGAGVLFLFFNHSHKLKPIPLHLKIL